MKAARYGEAVALFEAYLVYLRESAPRPKPQPGEALALFEEYETFVKAARAG